MCQLKTVLATKCYDIESHSQRYIHIYNWHWEFIIPIEKWRSTPPFFFFFSSNEILNLRLNICLSYLFVIVKTIYEKCKTKLRCYPSNNLFKHFSYKQFYSINMLFASFTLERYLKSTHTYRIGYHD